MDILESRFELYKEIVKQVVLSKKLILSEWEIGGVMFHDEPSFFIPKALYAKLSSDMIDKLQSYIQMYDGVVRKDTLSRWLMEN